MAPKGVLLMAYGTPDRIENVEEYYVNVRGGRPPTATQVAHLSERYAAVGGHTPLTTLTYEVADNLQERLNANNPDAYRVYVGMKYWHPLIPATVQQMAADGITEAVAIALAPHYSKISIGGYVKQVERAQEALEIPIAFTFVESWQAQPQFRQLIAERIQAGLAQFPDAVRDDVVVLFSAHSLPERVLEWGDPYPQELETSAAGIASQLEIINWRFTYQSQGDTGDPWLGPDILDMLDQLAAEGVNHVLSVAFGFVCDHLEILYDLDIECKIHAAGVGIDFQRIQLPNADPLFIDTLATIVREAETC